MDNIIYIAGPMRGLPDKGRENFRKAEVFLTNCFEWKVINPAVLPDDLPDKCYMPICLAMLQQADAIGLLPGWEDSIGATLEYEYAVATGKRIIDLVDEYGFDYEIVEMAEES